MQFKKTQIRIKYYNNLNIAAKRKLPLLSLMQFRMRIQSSKRQEFLIS